MQRGWKSVALALVATAALSSSAFAQRGGFGFGRGGGGANMLSMPEVQTELKLTDDQKTKVTDLASRLREQRRNQFQELRDLSPEERQKRMAEWRADENKQLSSILNADQMKRYHQLQFQQQGLAVALQDKAVADELKLTDDQRTKIQGIMDDQRNAMRELFQGGGGGDRQAMMQKMQDMRKQTDEKIAAALTDEQKSKWKEMIGAPFTFPAPRFGNRGAA